MKYMITGYMGLIGKELHKRLQSEGHVCKLAVDIREGKDIRFLDVEKNIKNINICFHLAAHCKINQSIKRPILPFDDNVEGTYEVLEYCRRNKIKNIVFFSSSRVLSEEKNPYTASKIYGEELCKAYKECYGINYIIIRPSTVYGPGEDKTNRLMNIWINNAKQNKDLEIFGNKNKTLDFTYIDDFLNQVDIAMLLWNKEYNISGKEELYLEDVAKEIIKQTNSKSKIVFMESEIAQPQQVKIENTINYKPKIKIKEGINIILNGTK